MEDDDSCTPWEFSKAKKQLIRDLADGSVDGMTCRQVYESRPGVYKTRWCAFTKFSGRFYKLRATIRAELERKNKDEAALFNDMALGMGCREKDYPIFNGSLAEEFLKLDIEDGLHKTMKPAELHNLRPAYKLWPAGVFRDCIYATLRDKRERPYWTAKAIEKKKEKLEKRKKKTAARRKREGV